MRKKICSLAASICLMGVTMSVSAINTGVPTTYSNVVWQLSTSVSSLSTCTELAVDLTGDLNNSRRVSVYGGVNCPAGTYPITGSAYVGQAGDFNMNLFLGAGVMLQCFKWPSLNGSCTFLQSGTGTQLGTGYLTLK